MGIDKTESLLKQFDFRYERINNGIEIKLAFSQMVIIDYSDPEKVKIKDRLVGWNFLTGLIEISVRYAILVNAIASLLIALFLMVYLDSVDALLIYMFYILTWNLPWTLYFTIKAESLKRSLMDWNILYEASYK